MSGLRAPPDLLQCGRARRASVRGERGPMTQRYEDLTDELTLDEQARLAGGAGIWHTAALPERGIPAVKVSDGPVGVRGESYTTTTSASFPCGSALGATFDPELVERVGAALGRRGPHQGRPRRCSARRINLHRHPARRPQLRGLQRGPAAHGPPRRRLRARRCRAGGVGRLRQALRGQRRRDRAASRSAASVDERTLREVYLRPFEAAVARRGRVDA